MSANSFIDPQCVQFAVSICSTLAASGWTGVVPCSGAVIGTPVDLLHANAYTAVFLCGVSSSGQAKLQVQTSNSTASGTFTDPTSGLNLSGQQLTGAIQSGGLLWVNSGGLLGGLLGPITSGQVLASGFFVTASFQRPNRYARCNIQSGDFIAGSLTAGFMASFRTTGSGGGFSQSGPIVV